jgi:hypothetical protein
VEHNRGFFLLDTLIDDALDQARDGKIHEYNGG